jgi:hypothetical protein
MLDDLWELSQGMFSDEDVDNVCISCAKVLSIKPARQKVALQDAVEFQVETNPPKRYDIVLIDLSGAPGIEIMEPYNSTNGRIKLKFVERSLSSTEERIVVAEGGGGRVEARITVSLFKLLWKYHPGLPGVVCDTDEFTNQCAMRMGVSLESSDIRLPDGDTLRKCTTHYDYPDHRSGKISGHVLAAQELATWLDEKSQLATWLDENSTIPIHMPAKSKEEVKGKTGIIFFLNGWGPTDHIDVWDGESLKGGDDSYFDVDYEELWFWEVY